MPRFLENEYRLEIIREKSGIVREKSRLIGWYSVGLFELDSFFGIIVTTALFQDFGRPTTNERLIIFSRRSNPFDDKFLRKHPFKDDPSFMKGDSPFDHPFQNLLF